MNLGSHTIGILQSDLFPKLRIFHIFQEEPEFGYIGQVSFECGSDDEECIAHQLVAEICGVGFLIRKK